MVFDSTITAMVFDSTMTTAMVFDSTMAFI